MRSPTNKLMAPLVLLLALALTGRADTAPNAAPTTSPAGQRNLPDIDPVVSAFLKPAEMVEGDDELRQKSKQRYNTAVRLLELRIAAYRVGRGEVSLIFDAAQDVAAASRDLAQTPEERQTVAKQFVEVMRVGEKRVEQQFKSGLGSEVNYLRVRLAREAAEVELLKLTKSSATQPATQPRQ